MPFKDLVVHLENTEQGAERLKIAVDIAARHDAHLTGIATVTYPRMPGYIEAQIGKAVMEEQHRQYRADADATKPAFEEAVRAAGLRGEWRGVIGDQLDVLQLHGRYSDMVIVGQREPDLTEGAADMPDQLILSLGRPVLVVPYAGHFDTVGKRVMVGWDGSRLSTRAVHAAMPFLEAADQVSVMCVDPKNGLQGDGDLPGADLALHLARHDVKADAEHVTSGDLSVGDVFLSRAADEGIDLLVIGAYGHARWREIVLGGVTRDLLAHMTVPVLLSH
ncbi:MAG: universal stress protein [Magnetovibrionaceae bacterium]